MVRIARFSQPRTTKELPILAINAPAADPIHSPLRLLSPPPHPYPLPQSAKLRVFAMLATLYPDKAYFFWLFVGALVVNSVYPFILLNATSRWWRRDAVAFIDIGLVRDCLVCCVSIH